MNSSQGEARKFGKYRSRKTQREINQVAPSMRKQGKKKASQAAKAGLQFLVAVGRAGEKGDVHRGTAGCRSQRSAEVPKWRATQARRKQELKNQTPKFGIKFTNR